MTTDATDPAATLEHKLEAFAATLDPDEFRLLHDVVHLARDNDDVQGFAARTGSVAPASADLPLLVGSQPFGDVFRLLGNLHLHVAKCPSCEEEEPIRK